MSTQKNLEHGPCSALDAAREQRADFDSVPLIDFSGMRSDAPAARNAVAGQLRDACIDVGFFYIANHGVPEELVDAMFDMSARVFALPLAEKMRSHVKTSSHYLGYVAMGDENADPTVGKRDMHEAYDFVPEDTTLDHDFLPGDFRRAGNLWPEVPGFREVATRYGIEMRLLARRMFAAFALALNLPESYFSTLASAPMSLIRMLHYPTQPAFSEEYIGTGAHTDHECFTILCQDRIQALQVRNRRGDWIPAPPIRGTFVVNIGDLMARWTNGIFASTYHRVSNTSGQARYSLPCFIGPNSDALIEALPSCVSAERPPKYSAVYAGEYVSSNIYHSLDDNTTLSPLKTQMKPAV
ncbi:MAG: 2-oxoglutarate and iron-dependent oxygenase domain-containing protein [Gammaproteobacteria bacterium]